MTRITAWAVAIVVVAAIAAVVFLNPLENRTTGEQPSPHALDQAQ